MSRPTITVRIAFASQPLAAPVWTDVTNYVRFEKGITIRRGRSSALGRMEAGTCSLSLINTDRRFEPKYTTSPYYPHIKPNRRINMRATWSGSTYDLFTGFIDEWPPDWPLTNDDSVPITATDGFKVFAQKKITLSRTQEYSNQRIGSLLDAIGWPSIDRSLIYGQSIVQAVDLTDATILDHMLKVAESENGVVFVGGAGNVVFQDRHWRLRETTATASQATFGDAAGELPYLRLDPSFDDQDLYNEVRVTRVGGTMQSAIDSASADEYLPKTLSKDGLLITTDNEALDAAQWMLGRYAVPDIRFEKMVLDGQADDGIWPHALGRTFSDLITVRRRPQGGSLIERNVAIEAVEHRIDTTNWTTTFQLSPSGETGFFVFDDPILGRFDENSFAY